MPPKLGTARLTSDGCTKIELPTIVPTTIATACTRPIDRVSVMLRALKLCFRLQTSDFRLQTSDFRLQTSDFRLRSCRIAYTRARTSGVRRVRHPVGGGMLRLCAALAVAAFLVSSS